MESADIVIAGGGAAGIFAAATIAEFAPTLRARVLEKGPAPLEKVARSGGGRCNLTHAPGDLREFARHYPRGAAEMLGALHRFGPAETIAWFEARGVPLKVEPDGRVFPSSDRSGDPIAALLRAAGRGRVEIVVGVAATEIAPRPTGFEVRTSDGGRLTARRALIATGGGAFPKGLDHRIEPCVPSLFPLRVADSAWTDLAGVSVGSVRLSAAGVSAEGPLVFTHEGISGPAVLDLTGWGARRLAELDYRFELQADWLPGVAPGETEAAIAALRRGAARSALGTQAAFGLPLRLWRTLLDRAGIPDGRRWSQCTAGECRALAAALRVSVFGVSGRASHRGEFVTCGGVCRKEVDFRTMESRRHPGLYFAGEILDVDGLTGGYNLQAAWTTGRIAAEAMNDFLTAPGRGTATRAGGWRPQCAPSRRRGRPNPTASHGGTD